MMRVCKRPGCGGRWATGEKVCPKCGRIGYDIVRS